ncbi:partner and localizer of BRCA2 [Ammospiza maritima maritima]
MAAPPGPRRFRRVTSARPSRHLRRAPVAMEAPPAAAALSGADKEKLREKLALLRREYSETVIRLRRARRAERARRHGLRERSPTGGSRGERGASGYRGNTSAGADRDGPSQLQTETCSDAGTEKTTSATVKHIPEFSSDEVSPQDSSRAESFQASQENLCCGTIRPVPVEKKPQTSRGMMKLRRRTKALESKERESVHDVHLISTGEMMKTQIASAEKLQSPLFRHSSVSHTEEAAQRAPGAVLVQEERHSFTPDAASGFVQDVFEGSVTAGEPELSPHVLRDSRDIWQPESSGAVATPDGHEPCSQHGDSVLLDPRGDGREESSSAVKQPEGQSLCEDQGELHGLLDLMSENEILPNSRNNTITEESKNHEGHQSDANTLNPCPADKALDTAEGVLENQHTEMESRLSPAAKAVAPEGTLSSCTVVEGLLFPVEYYVRTTRRMSNCQRKVDLDAVILSQLGRSKKGQRSKCKQKDANPNQPSQEGAEGDLEPGVDPFPFLGAENDQANSSSSQKSLPASSNSSTSLESVSQKSITSTRQEQRQSQRKQKGRRKSACKAPMHPVSQELIESQDPTMANESSALLSNENQSEKENCDANLERSSSDERRVSGAAALGPAGPGVTGATQPAGPDPPQGGSQVPGKCHKALLEQVQHPLHSSDSLSPGSDAFASHVGDVEGSAAVCQGDKHPVQRVKRQRGAEQLPGVSVPLRRSLRCSARHRPPTGSTDASSRGSSSPRGPQGPAAFGLPAADPDTRGSLFSFRSLQWLIPQLGIRDFHLPNEEFGVLKLEKLKSSPVNDLEDFVSGDDVAPEDTPDAQMKPKEKSLRSNLILPSKTGLPELPCMEGLTSKKELSTHELLFTPMGTVLEAPTHPEPEISSSVFPAVGATPGVLPSVHTEVFPDTPSVPALPVTLPSPRGAAALVLGDVAHRDTAVPPHPDSCAAGAARNQEEQGTALPSAAEGGPESKSSETVSLEKHQQPENKEQESCRASPEQIKDVAEPLTAALPDGPREESLQFVSELKEPWCSGAVDVGAVWWAAAGSCRELRVVTACESAVSLWQPRAPAGWARLHTWHLREIPVIQIVPLPDTCNLVCVALGELEIGEIRLLLYSSETDSFKHSLVKTGNIKAVAGLKDWRLVSSSRTMQEQQVEMVFLSETGGSKDRQTLMPPEETVTAFAEVEGMSEALVGTTAGNSVVVWNLRTGQLLRKMHVGYSYPASICHRAYSDSGLLFVVLSHPHAKESESCGSPAFRVAAFNPRTGRSAPVTSCCLPPGPAGRYLEGDVWDTAGAAVLTSGAVAVWDLLRGRCTAALPPGPAGHWALARWAPGGAGLLAGRRDGTVHLYRYRPPQPGPA